MSKENNPGGGTTASDAMFSAISTAPEATSPENNSPVAESQEAQEEGNHTSKRGKATRSDNLVVVGIGSSAGGLEALR